MPPVLDIAAYYFPQFHPDPRNDRWHGPGWSEWELMRRAEPRFPGHHQPRVPAWGYFDESDPAWSAREIALAADHGITAFLFDYYYYDDGPFLAGALEHGFLRAPNRSRLKFALMWANHDWQDWFPVKRTAGAAGSPLLCRGALSPAAFERFTDKIVADYFSQPNYLRIDGAPYFSLWDFQIAVDGLGGLDATAAAFARFRAKTRAAGHRDLHLNAMLRRLGRGLPPRAFCDALQVDSVTAYNFTDTFDLAFGAYPRTPYRDAMATSLAAFTEIEATTGRLYVPNITTGYDSSPRCAPSDAHANLGYPWFPVVEEDPAAFADALRTAAHFAAQRRRPPHLLTLNAWNEWTEGAVLLPDTRLGTTMLEQVRAIFPPHA